MLFALLCLAGAAALRGAQRVAAPRLRALAVANPSSAELFVRNVGDTTADELREGLSAAGVTVGRIMVPVNRTTGRSRGFRRPTTVSI